MSDISIIILHGWRIKTARYDQLKKLLEQKGFRVFVPEFPGFDGGKIPERGYTLSDYVYFLDNYIRSHKLTRVVFIGHSFGGRVIAKYCYIFRNNKKVLGAVFSGTPLVKEQLSFRALLGRNFIGNLNTVRKILPVSIEVLLREKLRYFIYRFIGEYDYYKAGDFRKTLVNILKDNPEQYLSYIRIPTLIIWGENDRITPVSIARSLHKKISQSQFILTPGATHKLPFEKPKVFADKVFFFIENING